MSNRDELDEIHTGLVADAKRHHVYAENTETALYGYSEGVEHALDTVRLKGYRKPQAPTTETIEAAARAVYAKTPSSKTFEWDLLPRIVQHEIRELALTAINTFMEASA